jgi:serine/threonine-protein kinase
MRTILAALVVVASVGQPAHAADYFGAIAVSPSTLALGWSYNFRSRAGAERDALRRCAANAHDCQIGIWFRNACGALASGNRGGWGAAWGPTRSAAIRNALNECAQHTGNCVWKRWVCTQH